MERFWSYAAMKNPSVSAFRPTLWSHWWMYSWSTSACWIRCGYRPCKRFISPGFFYLFAFHSLSFSFHLFRLYCASGCFICLVLLKSTSWSIQSLVVDKYLWIPIVVVLKFIFNCINPIPPSRLGTYNLSTFPFGWCILLQVNSLQIFRSIFWMSGKFDLMMLKPSVTTGMANVLIDWIRFAEFSSFLRI